MKVLITGITGMVGSHLAEYILAHHLGVEVHGLVRWRSPLDNIVHILSDVTLHHGELRDLNSLVHIFQKLKPDRIFHLAAQSYVVSSFDSPVDTLHTNTIGTTNLLDAVRLTGIDPKIHICSSSEIYGQVTKDEIPIRETNPFRPSSPYAVSKLAADMMGLQYFHSYGLKTIRSRMFTHTGARRGDVFAESSFAKQIAEIEAGFAANPVRVGNLESIRTVADVRDAVRAYWLLLEKCPAGEVYNIGGRQTLNVGEMLEILKGLARCKIEHVVDPILLRPSDVTLQIPETSKFRAAAGWEPQYSVEETLNYLLEYHRHRTGHSRIRTWKLERHSSTAWS